MTNTVFNNIAIIGAGTMGSGIAAQIANAGCDVLLLTSNQRTKTEKRQQQQPLIGYWFRTRLN